MPDDPKDLDQAKHEVEARHAKGGPFVQAVDTTSMAMIVTDCRLPDNPIVFANASFLELTGYALEEVLGKNYRILYGVQTDPDAAQNVEEALSAKGDIVLELMLYPKRGAGFWVMQHVNVQRENGQVKRHFASFWDIDRRVRAEREVRRSHALLEHRVAMRTRDLVRTVEDLRHENEKRRAAEEVLRHTLDDKDELIRQREFLLREVNHRVKNTLQMVSALLTVQAGSTDEKAIAEGLAAAIRRLDRLAEVHQLLYESADVGMTVDLNAYLTFLCDHLVLAADIAPDKIALVVDVEEGHWTADEAIPIALIVNEAVTNAIKHAFPGSRTGTVCVSLGHKGQNFHELVIADNGAASASMQRSGSLGMKLIDTFARQLRGKVQIARDGGTCVTVRFLHEDAAPPRLAE